MTKSREIEAEIRQLQKGAHLPVGTIATQLGVHPDVVRRVLGLLEPRPELPPRPLLVDPFKPFIAETLERFPTLRVTRLYDMVRPLGYSGAVRTLREYVQEVRPRPAREAFLRLSMLPGEQAQVDWAYVGEIPVPGGVRGLWLFVMVLAWSRASWGEFVIDLSVWSLLRSLHRACQFFGGTAREWLFDNPKIVTLERHGQAVRFHPLLLELSGAYAARLRVCRPRRGNEKGRVERKNRFYRDRFFPAREIRSIEQGNRELLAFHEDIAWPRAHPQLPGRTVRDCYEEERLRLLPLPEGVCTDQLQPVAVDKTAFCRFDTNDYSVPPQYAHRSLKDPGALTLVADDMQVRFLDKGIEVAAHPRNYGRRQVIEAPGHREAILATKPAAQEPRGRERLRAQIPHINALYERWVEVGRNLGSMTARTLKLLDLYGAPLLSEAVTQVLARGMHDPGALAALCEQRRRATGAPPPIEVQLAAHVHDREVIPHSLETYDEEP
jgi:transposase